MAVRRLYVVDNDATTVINAYDASTGAPLGTIWSSATLTVFGIGTDASGRVYAGWKIFNGGLSAYDYGIDVITPTGAVLGSMTRGAAAGDGEPVTLTMGHDGHSCFVQTTNGSFTQKLLKFSASGFALVTSWVPGPGDLLSGLFNAAVSPDDAIFYAGGNGVNDINRYNFNTSSTLSTLSPAITSVGYNSLFTRASGALLATHESGQPYTVSEITAAGVFTAEHQGPFWSDFNESELSWGSWWDETDQALWVIAAHSSTPYACKLLASDFNTPALQIAVTASTQYLATGPVGPLPPTLPTAQLVNSTPCCDTTPGAATTPSAGPVLPPVNTDWIPSCIGGGLVPTAADLTLAELWDY